MTRKIRTKKALNLFLTVLFLSGLILLGLWFYVWQNFDNSNPKVSHALTFFLSTGCLCWGGFFAGIVSLKLSTLE